MTNATPRPWKHGEGMCGHKVYSANPNAKHKDELARCYGDAHNEGAANAELIVKAVNQYDHVAELVEAAKRAIPALSRLGEFHAEAFRGRDFHEEVDALRSALAKMEVGQ